MEFEALERQPTYNPAFLRRVRERRAQEAQRQAHEESLRQEEAIVKAEAARKARMEFLAREAAIARAEILAAKEAKLAVELPKVVRNTVVGEFRRIMLRAIRVFGVTKAELLSERRSRRFVVARQFVMYWAARKAKLPWKHIGRLLKRDHTTVLWGADAYRARRTAMGRNLRQAR